MEKIKKIVIIGGHPTPAIALIDLLEQKKEIEIHFFGRVRSTEGDRAESLEYKLLSDRKSVIFHPITTGRLQRSFTKYTIPSLLKIPLGFFQSLYLLIKVRPKLVVAFGGYLSVPVVICAAILRIPIIIHEQTSVPGLSMKITSKFARKIFISFRSSQDLFNKTRTFFSGNLIRQELLRPQIPEKSLLTFLNKKLPLIYMTGGGQGSKLINDFITNNFDELCKLPYKYVIQTGSLQNSTSLTSLSEKIKSSPLGDKFFISDHFETKDVAAIYYKKPIVFGRSGANTVTEIFHFKLPAIFIPLGIAAGSEQLQNAQLFSNAGLAVTIGGNELNLNTFGKALKYLKDNFRPENFKNISSEIKVDTKNVLAGAVLESL